MPGVFTQKGGIHSVFHGFRYPTGPCLAQSRCSVNVWRMDGCHWTSEDPVRHLQIQTARDGGRRGGRHPAPPSGEQTPAQERSSRGHALSPPRGFKTHAGPGLLPLFRHWAKPPALTSNQVTAPGTRTWDWPARCVISGCRDVRSVWHPRLSGVLTGVKGTTGKTWAVSLQRRC